MALSKTNFEKSEKTMLMESKLPLPLDHSPWWIRPIKQSKTFVTIFNQKHFEELTSQESDFGEKNKASIKVIISEDSRVTVRIKSTGFTDVEHDQKHCLAEMERMVYTCISKYVKLFQTCEMQS